MLAVFYALIWSVTLDGIILPLCSGKFVFCRVLSKLINPSGVNLDLDSFLTNWRESRWVRRIFQILQALTFNRVLWPCSSNHIGIPFVIVVDYIVISNVVSDVTCTLFWLFRFGSYLKNVWAINWWRRISFIWVSFKSSHHSFFVDSVVSMVNGRWQNGDWVVKPSVSSFARVMTIVGTLSSSRRCSGLVSGTLTSSSWTTSFSFITSENG